MEPVTRRYYQLSQLETWAGWIWISNLTYIRASARSLMSALMHLMKILLGLHLEARRQWSLVLARKQIAILPFFSPHTSMHSHINMYEDSIGAFSISSNKLRCLWCTRLANLRWYNECPGICCAKSLGQNANVQNEVEKDSPHTPPESAAARVSFQLRPAINRWAQRFITVGTELQDNHPFLFSLEGFQIWSIDETIWRPSLYRQHIGPVASALLTTRS